MKVKVKLINSDKVLPIVPFKTYDKDYCYDITATSEEEGYKDSSQHLREIISELEKGFAMVAKVGNGTFSK